MRRSIGRCSHRATLTTITAGLAREVCEDCAHVTLRYVEPAVKSKPAPLELPAEGERQLRCLLCRQAASYAIPEGRVCGEHAWQAAARIRWDERDPWVPIPLDGAVSR